MTADLLYSDTEEALRSSLRGLLADVCPADRVRAVYDGDVDAPREIWAALATAMDLPGIGIPEDLGGGGAGLREVAVVMEELGRSVAPVPFLTSSVMSAQALLAARADGYVRRLADGSDVAAVAIPFGDRPGADLPAVTGTSLSGTAPAVAGADLATLLVVPALREGALVLAVVARADTDVTSRVSLDMTRPISDLSWRAAPVDVVAAGDAADAAMRAALLSGGAMLASEQVGVAEWCLATTVEYVRQRTQFGRPIGSFQALKHRLARLWIDVSAARAAARHAAVVLDSDDGAAAVSLARAFVSPVAVRAAEECVQMHGGIGMTWEHSAHLALKRAKADSLALGTAAAHRARLVEVALGS
jgi:alkylation response protein AidB-like acyl-CoA dehydrogenase